MGIDRRRWLQWIAVVACVHAGPAGAAPIAGLRAVELVVTDAHGTRRTNAPIHLDEAAPGIRAIRAAADDRDFALALSIGPGRRALAIEARVRPRAATSARLIAARLHFTARGFALIGRDYVVTRPHRAVLERFDPKWIALDGGPTLIVDDDGDAVVVASEPGGVLVELTFVAAADRPFGHLPRAGQHWREIKGRVAVPDRWFVPDDVLVVRGELFLGQTSPVALSPWPDGRAAAFVITDHADQSSTPTFHALLGGSSDADLAQASGGLLGHHLPLTKALFQRGVLPHGGARAQLEDPAFAALAEIARAGGIELVPHSPTPVTDDRASVERTLTWFAERGAHVWIDHQPQTNREGINQQGWHAHTGIEDLLEAHGYRDVWDLTEWTGSGLDERDPRHLDRAAPTLWPLGRLQPDDPASLWMFRSTWAFVPTQKFFARYDDAGLDQLERDHGLQIAHTYLETLHPPRTFLGRRNVMIRDADGRVRLDPRLEALFASLQRRSERASLWTTTLGALADRLRAMMSVRLRVDDDGALSVTRPAALAGVTIVGGGTLSGPAIAGRLQRGSERCVWLTACATAAPCTDALAATP